MSSLQSRCNDSFRSHNAGNFLRKTKKKKWLPQKYWYYKVTEIFDSWCVLKCYSNNIYSASNRQETALHRAWTPILNWKVIKHLLPPPIDRMVRIFSFLILYGIIWLFQDTFKWPNPCWTMKFVREMMSRNQITWMWWRNQYQRWMQHQKKLQAIMNRWETNPFTILKIIHEIFVEDSLKKLIRNDIHSDFYLFYVLFGATILRGFLSVYEYQTKAWQTVPDTVRRDWKRY